MAQPLSVKLPSGVKKRLKVIANRSRRSESALAAEAITAYIDLEESRFAEIHRGIQDADRGRVVEHDRVTKWLKTWGKAGSVARESRLVAARDSGI